MKKLLVLLVILALPSISSAIDQGRRVSSLLNLPIPETLELCGEPVPLDSEDVVERLDYELIVALGNPVSVSLWFKRSALYFPMIEEKLKARGLPEDLKYVPFIESNLRAEAIIIHG